jgi:hypothetical protein
MEAEMAEALGAEKANGWRAARATRWVITAGR